MPTTVTARIRKAACRPGPFRLPTGETIYGYFDEYLLAADSRLLHDVATAMVGQLPPTVDIIVGVALGGVPLAVGVSAASGLPMGILRREPKPYGTFRHCEGPPVRQRSVVLVDDVVRSGRHLLHAATTLRALGAFVTCAVCVLDRDMGARRYLADENIVLRSLLTPTTLSANHHDDHHRDGGTSGAE